MTLSEHDQSAHRGKIDNGSMTHTPIDGLAHPAGGWTAWALSSQEKFIEIICRKS